MTILGFESFDALKAYCTCLMLGISLLFAYNSLLSTPGYFQDYYKFAQNDPDATTSNPHFWKNVVSTISLISNIPNLLIQAALLHPHARKVTQHIKLMIGLSLMAIALCMIPMISVFRMDDSGAAAYLISCVVLCSLGTGIYQSTALSLVSGFPPKFVGVCIVGIGISGVISNTLGIITQAALSETYNGENTQSKVFYSVAGGVIVVTAIALAFFRYNPFALRHVPEYRDAEVERSQKEMIKRSFNAAATNNTPSETSPLQGILEGATQVEDPPDLTITVTKSKSESQALFEKTSAKNIFLVTMPMQLSVLLTFVITLFVMPSLAVAVDPEATWYPILVITTFNVFDTVGRYIPNIKKLWVPRKVVPIIATARLLLIPLWFFCYNPRWIHGYVYPMILMAVTGITNGYTGCMSMVYAPMTEGVINEAEKNVSGNIVSFMLLCGCAIGSFLGWVVTTYS